MVNQKRYSNVIDSPLKPGGKDSLGVESHVKSLVEFIRLAQMPTTMAIQGEWGSGKTSLMNQVSYQLCEMSDEIKESPKKTDEDKLYYGIWLNTWQYSLMKSPEETLISIIKKITEEVTGIMEKRFPVLESDFNNVRLKMKSFVTIGAKAIASHYGVNIDKLQSNSKDTDESESNPLAFRKALTDAIAKCLEESKKNNSTRRGFLFFIDDLDRLDPPLAVQILEILKNIFEVNNCIFVLAIDYDVVVKGLEPKFGKLTDKNEREFRSFFDKIIQLPFNMPVGRYEIDTYLAETLEEIGYFSKEEIENEVIIINAEDIEQDLYINNVENRKTNDSEKLSDILVKMVRLSTGFNPRAIKRLINTLSLILIMNHNKHANLKEEQHTNLRLNLNDRLLIFGLICVQISYPILYNFLEIEPNIKGWDEKTATKHSLPALNNDIISKLEDMPEFDEGWEQILFRKCLNDAYLEPRAPSISSLLGKIWDNIQGEDDKKVNAITKILGVASVTTVNTSEVAISVNENQRKNIRFNNLEDFFCNYNKYNENGEVPPNIKKITTVVHKKLIDEYADAIRISFLRDSISFYIKSNRRKFLSIHPYHDDDGWFIKCKIEGRDPEYINTLSPEKDFSLTDTFFRVVKRSFNKLNK